MICKSHNAISKTLGQLNKIIKEKIWDTQKNTEVEDKWAQKKEEPEKEINENKFQLVNICYKLFTISKPCKKWKI